MTELPIGSAMTLLGVSCEVFFPVYFSPVFFFEFGVVSEEG